jgi:hypothetical protein
MANSVHKDIQGPDWPLGNIVVVTPGTQVSIMSLVDPSLVNAPENPTGTTTDEYTRSAQQIVFQGFKVGANPPRLANNTGNIYVVRKPLTGAGGTTDVGTIVAVIAPGQTFVLSSSSLVRNVFNLYRYLIDADNAGDACQVTAIMQ